VILGILGGGQLGWMLGTAARRLGIECVFLDPAEHCTADLVGDRIRAAYDDAEALSALARRCDVVTYEFENVPAESAARLAEDVAVRPGWKSLETSQDRAIEKTFLTEQGVPVPAFAVVDDLETLEAAVAKVGLPAILKTRRGGYDGKGQAVLRHPDDLEAGFSAIGGRPAILESMIDFEFEASVLVVRGCDGTTETWGPIRNEHSGGILRRSDCPAPDVSSKAASAMLAHAEKLARALDHCGVLTVEFFVLGDEVLANEMAPRVHNSGHLTIEYAETDQFENHVRAVTGLSLGATGSRHPHATMLNAIGASPADTDLNAHHIATVNDFGTASAEATVGAAVYHDYRKQPRPGRKVGHLTAISPKAPGTWADALAAVIPGASETEPNSDD
jgi:5-(carboxyamino)imidazole ribonucleotide synthase